MDRVDEPLIERFLDLTPDAAVIVNSNGRIVWVNAAAERMFAYTRDEMMGNPVESLMPERFWERHAVHRAGYFSAARPRPMGTGLELWGRRKDGSEFPADIMLSPLDIGEEPTVLYVVRDISVHKQAEEIIERQLETLTILYASAQKLSQSLDVHDLSDFVTQTCVKTFGARLAWVGRAEPDGSLHMMVHFPKETEPPRGISTRWDDSPQGQGLAGRALRSGFPQIENDIGGNRELAPERVAAWRERGFLSAAVFPLISRDKPFGVLAMYSEQRGFFSSARAELLQAFAHLVAGALENARLFMQAGRRLERLEALRDIDAAISGSLDLRVVLSIFLERVVAQLHADAADVVLFGPQTQTFDYAAGRGFRTAALRHTRLRLGEGYAGRAALERRIVSILNLAEAPGDFERAPRLAEEGFIAYHAAPLIAKGQVKGVLELFHRRPIHPDPEWLDFFETLTGQASIAIDNSTLFDDLQRANVDLVLAYDATLEGWGKALDLRHKETAGHAERVTELTVRLAEAMGMPEADLVHVRRGALLHDIGKMAIPDAILLKPAALTEEEWEVMRRHPVDAYELLSPIPYLQKALDIPHCHHEKWNGSGYPRGLKGEQIPLAARIFAVVDVWDALQSDRPYRAAWSRERTLEYIREQRGKHFDAKVVETFLKLQHGAEDFQVPP